MPVHDEAPLFSLFWENSKLSRHNIAAFADSLDEDARTQRSAPQLHYPSLHKLPRPDDELARLQMQRRSRRTFADAPLSQEKLGSLFFAASHHQAGRLHPSAGGTYSVELFAFFFHVEGPLQQKIVYYDGAAHALCEVAPCPPWRELAEDTVLPAKGGPAVLFVIVAMMSRAITRYEERGGRFLLLEAGHLLQNLALRTEAENLSGVLLGGLADDRFSALLRLTSTDAAIVAGYAVGPRADKQGD